MLLQLQLPASVGKPLPTVSLPKNMDHQGNLSCQAVSPNRAAMLICNQAMEAAAVWQYDEESGNRAVARENGVNGRTSMNSGRIWSGGMVSSLASCLSSLMGRTREKQSRWGKRFLMDSRICVSHSQSKSYSEWQAAEEEAECAGRRGWLLFSLFILDIYSMLLAQK